MARKALVPISGDEIAPRFDLASEVVIAAGLEEEGRWEEKIVVLPRASAEQLCELVLAEGAEAVICGGIEEEHYQYLAWKRVEVLDSVIGPWTAALERYRRGELKAGDILCRDLDWMKS